MGRRYYPKPSKFILIGHPDNLESGKTFGLSHEFKVCTGARYLGGFIREDESKHDWMKNCMETWERNIHMTRETVGKYPQESYILVVRAIQPEWIFLQRVTNDMGDVLLGVEKMIW